MLMHLCCTSTYSSRQFYYDQDAFRFKAALPITECNLKSRNLNRLKMRLQFRFVRALFFPRPIRVRASDTLKTQLPHMGNQLHVWNIKY